jgi:hypothetical protein
MPLHKALQVSHVLEANSIRPLLRPVQDTYNVNDFAGDLVDHGMQRSDFVVELVSLTAHLPGLSARAGNGPRAGVVRGKGLRTRGSEKLKSRRPWKADLRLLLGSEENVGGEPCPAVGSLWMARPPEERHDNDQLDAINTGTRWLSWGACAK